MSKGSFKSLNYGKPPSKDLKRQLNAQQLFGGNQAFGATYPNKNEKLTHS